MLKIVLKKKRRMTNITTHSYDSLYKVIDFQWSSIKPRTSSSENNEQLSAFSSFNNMAFLTENLMYSINDNLGKLKGVKQKTEDKSDIAGYIYKT